MAKKTETAPRAALPKDYIPRLKVAYEEKVLPVLVEELKVSSRMGAPKMSKIVLNIGVSEAKENIQTLDLAKEDLSKIIVHGRIFCRRMHRNNRRIRVGQ